MVKSSIANLNRGSVLKVVAFFSDKEQGKANDIGVSGAFMTSLRKRGYIKVVATEETFVLVDERNDLYRKMSINVYGLVKPISSLLDDYCEKAEQVEIEKINKANDIIRHAEYEIRCLERKIKDAKYDLEEAVKRLEAMERG